jgi:hypothetical protein
MHVRLGDGAGTGSTYERPSPVTRRGAGRATSIAEPSEPEEVTLTITAWRYSRESCGARQSTTPQKLAFTGRLEG